MKSDTYFLDGAAESCAIAEQDQDLASRCGPDAPIDIKNGFADIPAPVPGKPHPWWDKPGYVYFALSGDRERIKIGYSADPDDRLERLRRIEEDDRITILATIPGTLRREGELHQQFSHLHRGREWFTIAPEMVEFIGVRVPRKRKPLPASTPKAVIDLLATFKSARIGSQARYWLTQLAYRTQQNDTEGAAIALRRFKTFLGR